MSRRQLTFACMGARLVGTFDEAPETTGLLIVGGGNETRAGAFSGQAKLAAAIALAGHPVFRFDRRGVGDSEGGNSGFRGSAADIAAAMAAFLTEAPRLERIVGFGNCDAASALMLLGGAGMNGLVLANPWTVEGHDAAPPPDAIRARYREKLRNPKEWLRLFGGQVSLGKLASGLLSAVSPTPPPTSLAREMAAGLARFEGPVTILLADRDRTAQLFDSAWDKADPRITRCPDATHAFAEPHARHWLSERLLDALQAARVSQA